MTELTTVERGQLTHLEDTIERGMETFVEVGNALMVIRDGRLYRAGHESFDAYCRTRWQIAAPYASRLIQAAEVVNEIRDTPTTNVANWQENRDSEPEKPVPASEGVAREVAKAPKGQRAEAYRKAVETAPKGKDGKPKVTAAHVRRVVRQEEPAAPSNGKHADPDPVEPFEVPADPLAPWQEVAASTLRIISELETVADDMRRSYGADGKGSERRLTNPGAARYSWSGTIGVVNGLIDYLNKEMPIGADARGIVTATDQAKARAFRGGAA